MIPIMLPRLLLVVIIILIPFAGYSVGGHIDDYCWYGQTVYLGSDKPSKCLTQVEHDEMFTGEFWDELKSNNELKINELKIYTYNEAIDEFGTFENMPDNVMIDFTDGTTVTSGKPYYEKDVISCNSLGGEFDYVNAVCVFDNALQSFGSVEEN